MASTFTTTFNLLILIPLIIFLIILFTVIIPRRRSSDKSFRGRVGVSVERKGAIGELIVAKTLGDNVAGVQYLINDVIVTDNENHSSQIDHIFINKYGVWVIETKNYSGMIFGKGEQREWVQVLAGGRVKNKFLNPIKQNNTHVFRIKSICRKYTPIKGIVVFIDGDLSNVSAENVYTLRQLKNVVNSPMNDSGKELSSNAITRIYEKLSHLKENQTLTIEEHIENIQKIQTDISNGICPNCGGELVLRKGKYGSFYGCSNYPKCKFTKNVDDES